MLEIFLLIWLGKKLARIAGSKGRSGGWAALGVGFWVLGEIIGFIIGAMMGLDLGAYVVAIMMAAGAMGIAFLIVSNLPDLYKMDEVQPQLMDETYDLTDASDPENPYSPPRQT